MASLTTRIHRWEAALLARVAPDDGDARLARTARAVTHSADGPAFLVLPAALLALGSVGTLSALLVPALAFAIERPVYLFLKETLRRPRPFERVEGVRAHVRPPDRFSFPSGHTSAAALACVLVGTLVPAALVPLAVWAAAVGASRIYLGVHYPSDVLAGAALGAFAARLALAIVGA